MPKYRKKPVVIDAVQWKGGELSNSKELRDFLFAGKETPYSISQYEDDVLVVRTLEGEMLTKPGDWIIRGVAGELYPCKPKSFDATYVPAGEEPEQDDLGVMLNSVLGELRRRKPNDRSPVDRSWAIAITEMEKLLAYWVYWVALPLEDEAKEEDGNNGQN